MMTKAETLAELLANNRSVKRSITYLETESSERVVSYGELYERAIGILFHLQKLGARPGDKLIIYLANNEQFLDAFWAGMLGGIVPVPVALGISDEHKHKLLRIAKKLGKPFIYTDRKTLERIGSFAGPAGEQATFDDLSSRAFFAEQVDDISKPGKLHAVKPDDTAFIQFSSGSTSEPKGIVLTHRNIIANSVGAGDASLWTEDDVNLTWMPLTHDMGLIGMHIMMFARRMQLNVMPTELFIRRPLLWMTFAARKGATVTSSPNFGFRHYLKVLGDRAVDLDLSSLRLIYNGAEPISVELAEEFMTRLEPAKLRRTAMYPVYGLAEATLVVSFPQPPGELYEYLSVNRHELNVGKPPALLPKEHPDALAVMAVGQPIPYSKVRIAGDDDKELPENHIGHILISGDNVTKGYFENPEANAKGFTAADSNGIRWLRTGDLGMMKGGKLFITGRAKEIIFVNGQNYYPHDIESIAIRAEGLELGKVVAAGVRPKGASTDDLIIFVLHRMDMKEFMPLAAQVTRLVNEHTGLEVAHVVPVKRVPKTTSGKIQRHLLEEDYVNGVYAAELAELAELRAAADAAGVRVTHNEIERKIKDICDASLARNIDVNDNLFEIGASSLKLIEIHEQIDRIFPGLIDLTELFDFPTIAELSRHLEGKLAATV
ncbi:MAG TPA: non-ribosomal peptide synthetase [Steroidobacteraceae bacterium]|jgi:acyl-CoA synthetase (AMP-forming)/AMP-acid ligase II/acyl carrier protein|nr:non-ribosomal peptide synthetase [Steroidobacteraceae bacterium]